MPEQVATQRAWDFARVEEFWSRFTPLTPYGRDARELRLTLDDRASLEALYDAADAALRLTERSAGPTLDRVRYHLGRMPRLPLDGLETRGEELEVIEVFQVKKFLSNLRAVVSLLDEDARAFFRLHFASVELAALLDAGGSDPETFFIADSYEPSLAALRAEIAEVDEALRVSRAARAKTVLAEQRLDFAGRDFLVVPHETARSLLASCAERSTAGPSAAGSSAAGRPATEHSAADPLVTGRPEGAAAFIVEAYDGESCIVRLQDDETVLLLEERRSILAGREREAEVRALRSLTAAIVAEAGRLRAYVEAIRDFDLALARARLTKELGLVRPRLGSERLAVARGVFLPCAKDCEAMGLRYTPVDLDLPEPAAVIFGSNMGGKTVALQSLLFFQILAQAGHFVPAQSFKTVVHSRIVYVGGLEQTSGREEGRGLSGFGFEIRSFVEAVAPAMPAERASLGAASEPPPAAGPSARPAPSIATPTAQRPAGPRPPPAAAGPSTAAATEPQGAFIVFDEFARTTASREAEAILSAAIESLASTPGGRALFSTHFHGVRRVRGVRFLRMLGLDRRALGESLETAGPLAERIRRINGLMRYELAEEDERLGEGSDAIAIASLLGLDRAIVERATTIYSSGE